eukprot:4341246-Pyramimonas_sp.AAC.1
MMMTTKSRSEWAALTARRIGAAMWSLILGGFDNLFCFQILCPWGGSLAGPVMLYAARAPVSFAVVR